MHLLTEILGAGSLFSLAAFVFFALFLRLLWDQFLEGLFVGLKSGLIVCVLGSVVAPAVLSWEFLGARFTLIALVGFTLIWSAAAALAGVTMLVFAGARRGLARAVSKALAGRRTRALA